jgi:hypothetical protein
MEKKIWRHPLTPAAIKRKVLQIYQNPGLSDCRSNAMAAASPDNTGEPKSRMDPWIGLFADPALHEALDRIMASNRIT